MLLNKFEQEAKVEQFEFTILKIQNNLSNQLISINPYIMHNLLVNPLKI